MPSDSEREREREREREVLQKINKLTYRDTDKQIKKIE
jgi:hypothetical protein